MRMKSQMLIETSARFSALYLGLQKIPGHVILIIPLEEYDRNHATERHRGTDPADYYARPGIWARGTDQSRRVPGNYRRHRARGAPPRKADRSNARRGSNRSRAKALQTCRARFARLFLRGNRRRPTG